MSLAKLNAALTGEVAALEQEGRAKAAERIITGYLPPKDGRGPRYRLQGSDRDYIRMNSNSYLSLSFHPALLEAADEASRAFGAGPGAVRFIDGTFAPHVEGRPLQGQQEARPRPPTHPGHADRRRHRRHHRVPRRLHAGETEITRREPRSRSRPTTSTTSATGACAPSASSSRTRSASGLARMERVVRERMTTQDVEAITPQTLINIRPVVASIKEFFGTSQLSQFMDQTNPLAGPDAQAPPVGARPGRPVPRARRVRGPRRPPVALRPDVPDRDAGRPEHRPDRLAVAPTAGSTRSASSRRRTARSTTGRSPTRSTT